MGIKNVFENKKAWLAGVVLITITTAFFAWFKYGRNPGPNPQMALDELEVLQMASTELKKLWFEGDVDGDVRSGRMSCLTELGEPRLLEEHYLRCNPGFIECYFRNLSEKKGAHFEIDYAKKKWKVNARRIFPENPRYNKGPRHYKSVAWTPKNPPGIFMTLVLEGGKKQLPILLGEYCHEIFLPKRVYAGGPQPKNRFSDWEWDNFNRQIFIEKFLVSYRDIAEWMDQKGLGRSYKLPDDKAHLSDPATGLSFTEMRNYCFYKGKTLLESHILDAASFYPGDSDNPKPERVMRGPYPWSNKRQEGFLYKALKDKEFVMGKKNCNEVYSKECLDLVPYNNFATGSASWMGIFHVLGGYLEAVENRLEPSKNLKASSFYFPASSPWHEIGMRAFWDGEGDEEINFKWDLGSSEMEPEMTDEQDKFKVGFRCMREVYEK